MKVTVLERCLLPKLAPVSVTDAPTAPDAGLILVMLGAAEVTVKAIPLLACVPTVTTALPVVAPAGTATAMLVALQLVGDAVVPLNVTVLEPWVPPKLVPAKVTDAPTIPDAGVTLVMLGADEATVKFIPLLATLETTTTTLPVIAPTGTTTVMLVALQFENVTAVVPPKVTVLLS